MCLLHNIFVHPKGPLVPFQISNAVIDEILSEDEDGSPEDDDDDDELHGWVSISNVRYQRPQGSSAKCCPLWEGSNPSLGEARVWR